MPLLIINNYLVVCRAQVFLWTWLIRSFLGGKRALVVLDGGGPGVLKILANVFPLSARSFFKFPRLSSFFPFGGGSKTIVVAVDVVAVVVDDGGDEDADDDVVIWFGQLDRWILSAIVFVFRWRGSVQGRGFINAWSSESGSR